MSLLRQVQHMVEGRDRPTGVNLEHFIVGPQRTAQLCGRAGGQALAVAAGGCTFLQAGARELRLALYFPENVIAELEANDPRQSLNERNISPMIAFVEEIAHAVHAGYLYLRGQREFASEDMLCNLETQAKVDTYLVLAGFAGLLVGRPLPAEVRDWLDGQVFDASHQRMPEAQLRARYSRAEDCAWKFLQLLRSKPSKNRPVLLRSFRQQDWWGKLDLVA